MVRELQVVPYDSRWPERFAREADRLRAIFGAQVVAIHHIGSTAIPNVSAKPIIDVLVEVASIEAIDAFNQEMIERGYLPKGEFGIPGRRFFIKGTEERRSHHVHVFQAGDPEMERHLAFRDYMIAHPDEAEAYTVLKRELAREFPHDAEGYMAGKNDFIVEVERKTLAWRRET